MDDIANIEYGYPSHSKELRLRLSDVEVLKQLDTKAQQELLDSVFTNDRREDLLNSASKDSHGRKVRYFRNISVEQLQRLLISGEQSQYSYVNELADEVNFDELRSALGRRLTCFEEMSVSERRALSRAEFFEKAFGGNASLPEIEDVLEHFDYAHVLPFLDMYVDKDTLIDIHAGGLSQKFSPFLSLSVGSVIRGLSRGRVYLELVFPDESIMPHTNEYLGMQGEKEVFTRRISLRNVSRIYVDNETLWRDEIENPTRPISKYCATSRDPIDEWRWGEDTRDYLPVSLLPMLTR